jgi:hypothetical protein
MTILTWQQNNGQISLNVVLPHNETIMQSSTSFMLRNIVTDKAALKGATTLPLQ